MAANSQATHPLCLSCHSPLWQCSRFFCETVMPQSPWKAWYKLVRWRNLRLEIFRRDLYTCRCGCGLIEGNTSRLVCDHIKPHRGDERLFWDETNLQTLLKSCHDSAKQRAEQASLNERGVWY